ncbi:hypothetical protein [uncultured Phycicoccus sp.]|uniref:hypothetical protein n=1 Tax=uncultured Phycicoccus sp. TaxID=661422 RepID=UPI002637DE81|nr:hypothetical protein [uncultured Phycicoccus sp.]
MAGGVAAVVGFLLLAVALWPSRAGTAARSRRAVARGSTRTAPRLAVLALRRLGPWRRRTAQPSDWVADLGEVVAVGLRAGLDLPAALGVGARTPAVRAAAPWLGQTAATLASEPAAPASHLSSRAGLVGAAYPDLLVLARAWQLSERTGAMAAHTTAAAARAIRARTAARHRTEVALAGPRASMRLLCALPVAGPVVTLFVGLDPRALYGSSASWLAAGAGLGLTAVGWWWSAALVRHAHRPATTAADP